MGICPGGRTTWEVWARELEKFEKERKEAEWKEALAGFESAEAGHSENPYWWGLWHD